jgi:aryl-alcohol dehydrogenase-like predicted oxidoreductase
MTATETVSPEAPARGTLPRRKLGRSGVEVSLLACGTWGLCAESYGAVFPEQRTRTLERALERGITTFDMAPAWGPDGLSERAVAAAVGTRRNEVVYVTRAGQQPHELGFLPDFSAAGLRAQCEASLRTLATDHLDVWLLHNPEEHDLRGDELLRTAEALVTEGKVRAWGASVSHVDQARAAITAGAQVLCLPHHVLSTELLSDVGDDCAARGVGVLVRSPLFHGLLSGVYSPGKRFAASDHRVGRFSPEALSARLTQAASLRALVKPPLRSAAALALRFAAQHHAVGSVVFGPRASAHVDAATDAFEDQALVLDDELLRALRRVQLA